MSTKASGAKSKASRAKTHDECRQSICAICYSESGLKASRSVSPSQEKQIKLLINADYSIVDKCYPSGLCHNCHTALTKIKSGQPVTILSVSEHFGSPVPPQLRNHFCDCIICRRSRLNGLQWKQFVRECKGSGKKSLNKICPNCLSKVKTKNKFKPKQKSSTRNRNRILGNRKIYQKQKPTKFSIILGFFSAIYWQLVAQKQHKEKLARFAMTKQKYRS